MQSSDKVNIKEALNERDGFQVWWRLLRPHTLTASFIPVFVGSMLAFREGYVNLPLFIAMLIAAVLIQAATNMFNEYYDFVKGLDSEDSVGIGGTIVRDGIKPKTVLQLALGFYGIAILLGIYICLESSWWIAVIGLGCMVFGYLYTGGPLPIAYTPLGELFSGFLMGTVIIGISYFIQAEVITPEVIFASIPIALFIGAIMLSNNIRDLDNDKENGRKTLAILLGRRNAVRFLASMFIIAFMITAILIIADILPIWSIITFIGAVKAVDVINKFKGKTQPIEMMPAMAATGKTNSIYGLLLGVSLFISMFI
ncbi:MULTISPECIES: 1,4-dihydroxy-2-naphthoate polyprenyltransferase [Virgibacillus]|uniref:1,4-dihydroxy-2-naphthoate octaprenyltransferase n=2 Tax=Virgibacillus TaxID=84406 RepID=A0A024Q9M2_9BACI|nr:MULTISPECIES: 1,4-dihydroxy-2-naphthoate polyprenyltransferase [Virgibacillus]EQB37263.1 1,4-dihydroxy-2-naphthoate prenyltransferase [Virgibacillus sp. CM-4]GGJ62814.1 1,4-dihydroxy-2-naphthoate octaprenyltransferase [Virgibacillus kapii]CDQ39238.1 1,4-dihydroxy-2-naphthoate octaprenyltransferase [Virgibacillus massiliensis]